MEQQPRLPLWFLVANWALILAAFVAGVFVGGHRRAAFPEPQAKALDLVYEQIRRDYVDPTDGAELLDRAIGAMAHLDPYSTYIAPSDFARYEEDSTGRYEGVGMVQLADGDDLVVHWPFPGGPAERAGVLPGDVLIGVDDQQLAGLPREGRAEKAISLVRGPAGSDVRLRMRRGDHEVELTVRRGAVQQPAVRWAHLADPAAGLGYVYVVGFHPGVAAELNAAIDHLAEGGALKGLVIDLRWNGGGSLDECVAMACAFQPTGTIVSTRRRNEVVETRTAKAGLCRYPDLPLVVLVDEHSASASEVFSGCLQDHHRAAVVGVRTYGKGMVNTYYTWKDLAFGLKLTTAHYFTPNGRNIEGHVHRLPGAEEAGGEPADLGGIAPDALAPIDDAQRRTIAIRLAAFEVPAAHRAAFAEVAARRKLPVPAPLSAAEDPQLAKALETLRARLQPAAQGDGGKPEKAGQTGAGR